MTPRPAPKRLCFSSLSCASRNKVGLFRCVKNWIVQFGIAGDPAVGRKWRAAGSVRDDPQWLPADGDPEARFKRGLLSFAGAGANSRATEMFLAFKDIGLGGALHEVPFARVVDDGVGYATMDQW